MSEMVQFRDSGGVVVARIRQTLVPINGRLTTRYVAEVRGERTIEKTFACAKRRILRWATLNRILLTYDLVGR